MANNNQTNTHMVSGMRSQYYKKYHTFFCGIIAGILGAGILASRGEANNLKISDFNMASIDAASNIVTFSCDVSWENSWRTSTNYDAVWMFMKYSKDGGATWHHASIRGNGTNPMGFSVPSNFEAIVPADEKGFFFQRTDLSIGAVSAEGLRFVWDYAQDGLSDAEAAASNTITKVFGIEMVYVPVGSFHAGDGNSSSEYRFTQGSADADPWYIESENAISTTVAANDGFYYQSTGAASESATGAVFLIPTSFPKGYKAFYVMKYELTEGQWVDFFNTLSPAAKAIRDMTVASEGGKNSDAVVTRNTVSWDATDVKSPATTLRPDRPMTYVSWPDVAAYADWAGVRPITELEYEKAARGADIAPVANEYAWGTTSYNAAEAGEIYPNADEDGVEQIFDGAANINRNALGWSAGDGRAGGIADGQAGPLRVGIFAESSTNRVTSGAGYYGAMELSGNVYELVVTVGTEDGRQFLGTHGDGEVSMVVGYEGHATNNDWPGINGVDAARGVTETVGSGLRGGDFVSSGSNHFQISNRTYAAKNPDGEGYAQRYDMSFGVFQGGRLGRTAP